MKHVASNLSDISQLGNVLVQEWQFLKHESDCLYTLMIEAKTCLVLGAGASAPYGLPPARALRDLILVQQVPDSDVAADRFAPAAGTEQFTGSAREHAGFARWLGESCSTKG